MGLIHFSVCFFKQKTAYEMRISDWSSDVCSSDPIFQPEVAARAIYWAAHERRREVSVGYPTVLAIVGNKNAPGFADRYLGRKNGRAVCRARVCPSVSLSVGAVTLKKTSKTHNTVKLTQRNISEEHQDSGKQ